MIYKSEQIHLERPESVLIWPNPDGDDDDFWRHCWIQLPHHCDLDRPFIQKEFLIALNSNHEHEYLLVIREDIHDWLVENNFKYSLESKILPQVERENDFEVLIVMEECDAVYFKLKWL